MAINIRVGRLKPIYIAFALMAMSTLSILALWMVPKLLLNSEVTRWDSPKIQAIISQTLDRPVKLEKAVLHIGFSGIKIGMPALQVLEHDGAPFINCGETEIEIAALPMLFRKVVIQKVSVQSPEIYLKRSRSGQWNFSDIPALQNLEAITAVKLLDGRMHLEDDRDIHPASMRSTDWQNVNFSFVHQFGPIYWPYELSLAECGPDSAGTLFVKGAGTGRLDLWQNDKYSVKVEAHALEPLKLSIFFGPVPEIKGLVNLEFKGDAIGIKQVEGEAKLRASDLRISPPGLSPVRVRNLDTFTRVKITPEELGWHDLSIHVGATAFSSDGALTKWTSELPQYFAHIHGHVDDLGELLRHIDAPWIVTGLKSLPSSLAFKGDLAVRGFISSKVGAEKFSADASFKNAEFLLKKEKLEAKDLNGGITFENNGVRVRSVTGIFDGARFVATGSMVPGKEVELNLNVPSITIASVRSFLALIGVKAYEQLIETYKFRGKMHGDIRDLRADIFGEPNKLKLKFDCRLGRLAFDDGHGASFLKVDGGSARFDDRTFALDKVVGSLGRGTFQASGFFSRAANAPMTFSAKTDNIDIASLKRAIDAANLKIPWIDDTILSGQLGSASATLAGTFANPQIGMQSEIKDLIYHPLGSSQVAHLRSGQVIFQGEQFRATDLGINTPNSQLTVTATIDNAVTKPKVSQLAFKNANVDIGELLAFASAKTNPVNIQSFIQSTLKNLPFQNLKGKLTMNCASTFTGKQASFQGDGSIQLLDFTAGMHHIVLTSGEFTGGSDNLSLNFHKVMGTVDNTTFIARGTILTIDPHLQSCRLRVETLAQVAIQDLTSILNDQANILLQLQSKRPLKLRGRAVCDTSGGSADFVLDVPKDAGVKIGSNLTRIVQPGETPVQLKGSLNVDSAGLTINNGKIDMNGLMLGFSSKAKGIIHGAKTDRHFAVNIDIPDNTDISRLLALVPEMKISDKLGELTGQANGLIHFGGKTDAPKLAVNLQVTDVAVPRFKLGDLQGTLTLPRTSLLSDKRTPPLPINLHLDHARCAGVELRNFEGLLIADSTADNTFELKIQNLSGVVAKGTLGIDGTYVANDSGDLSLAVAVKDVDANVLYRQMTGLKDEISGSLSLSLKATASTADVDKIRSTLCATGEFHGVKGRIAQFSALQTKLEEARILEQGVLGLSAGNLFAPLEKWENGEFDSLDGNFAIDHGLLSLKQFRFQNQDLALQVQGTANLISKDVHMQGTGSMARFEKEGKIGKVTSVISVGGLIDFVAKETSLHTPDIPVLGGVSSAARHSFVFQVNANLDQPSTIAKAITKSFRWTSEHSHRQVSQKSE